MLMLMLNRGLRRAALFSAAVAGSCLTFGADAQAGVTVLFNSGTTNVTTALTGFSTSGDEMAGMTVLASFSGGATQQAVWATTGSGAGAASGSMFRLSQSGDTFDSVWTLTNLSGSTLSGLSIDAGKGNTVFDVTWSGDGTPGSANGKTFSLNSGPSGLDITATYVNLVALTGHSPVGDLYRNLNLAFTNGLNSGDSITFYADTDNLRFAGDIGAVPEPSSLAMASIVVLGLAGYSWRRKAVPA